MARAVDYDSVASAYDRRYAHQEYAGVERAVRRFVAGAAGARLAEVGCGTGYWLSLLAAEGLRVAGVDASRAMLGRAQARVPGAALARASAERLPWRDARFDRVLCVNAFHHFGDKPACASEARRVLRPGGGWMTVGLDPHSGLDRWSLYDYFEGTLARDRERYPPAARIRAWMEAAGLRDCETFEAQHMLYRLPAREALAHRHLDRAATSQLTLLTEAEYRRGVERIRDDIRAAESRGETLELEADLRLHATLGWVRGALRPRSPAAP